MLVDRTMVLYGSNLGDANAHSTSNMPILLAGGGFRHAGHLAFDRSQNYPLPNLFVSMLQRMQIRFLHRDDVRVGDGPGMNLLKMRLSKALWMAVLTSNALAAGEVVVDFENATVLLAEKKASRARLRFTGTHRLTRSPQKLRQRLHFYFARDTTFLLPRTNTYAESINGFFRQSGMCPHRHPVDGWSSLASTGWSFLASAETSARSADLDRVTVLQLFLGYERYAIQHRPGFRTEVGNPQSVSVSDAVWSNSATP